MDKNLKTKQYGKCIFFLLVNRIADFEEKYDKINKTSNCCYSTYKSVTAVVLVKC